MPLPIGGANTQDATVLGGASREQNVLLRATKGSSVRGLMCCPPFEARGLFLPSFWENALGTKQLMEKGGHKRHHVPSKGLRELTCEFASSFIHSFVHQMCIKHLLSARHWDTVMDMTDKVPASLVRLTV